jgi:hypothetical protein
MLLTPIPLLFHSLPPHPFASFPSPSLIFSVCVLIASHYYINSLLENEVDGSTLLKLSETMVMRLLPMMKLQVKFMDPQKSLLVGEQPCDGAAIMTSPPGLDNDTDVARPSPSEQNG